MLGTPQLKIQATSLVQENPLLPKSTTNQLCDRFFYFQTSDSRLYRYIDLTRTDIHGWLETLLMKEKDVGY